MPLYDEVHESLDPGVDRIEEGKHPDIGDAMNLLGRVVAAIEHLARRIDEAGAFGSWSPDIVGGRADVPTSCQPRRRPASANGVPLSLV